MSTNERKSHLIKGVVGRVLILVLGMLCLHFMEFIALLDVSTAFDFTGQTEAEQQ